MSLDAWYEVEDSAGIIYEFRTLEEATEFAESIADGEWVSIRKRYGVGEEDA